MSIFEKILNFENSYKLSGIATLLNESQSKDRTGEYSYGTGGFKFPQTAKVSKFDEDKLKIWYELLCN